MFLFSKAPKDFPSGAEVRGNSIKSFLGGLGTFREEGLKILKKHGLSEPQETSWYSAQIFVNACRTILEAVGPNALFAIGKQVLDNAEFPPEINSLEKALGSLDVAYHMNHRLNGVVLFDPQTGKMGEGIGHYRIEMTGRRRETRLVCDEPYPCDFDRGLIESICRRFRPAGTFYVNVKHEPANACRKQGAGACNYVISW